jgi:serine phosphatase RsbU (regulator of sigma subunit)
MTAVVAHWDPATHDLGIANCGHVPPLILRAGGVEQVGTGNGHGLGGRASPKPDERSMTLAPGERLVMVSDGVIGSAKGQAGLGVEGVAEAAKRSERATAADTVREIHRAVLDASNGELTDDATAVCLSVQ